MILLLIVYLSVRVLSFSLFNWAVAYKPIGERSAVAVANKDLQHYIHNNLDANAETAEEILKESLRLTSDQLHFAFSKCDRDPNELVHSKAANCVGYAAFSATACNSILKQKRLDEEWKARAVKGQVYLFGHNLHAFFTTPFFKDHDFVILENRQTKEVYYADPGVHDYFGVELVKMRE